jgi:peptidoglycan hydrolase-like protein with peptidoglycan-binding domain
VNEGADFAPAVRPIAVADADLTWSFTDMASIRTITVAALAVTLLAGGLAPAKAANELVGGILGGAAGAGIGGALGGGKGAAIGGVLGLGLGALGANKLSQPKAEQPAAAPTYQQGQRDLTFAVQNELLALGYDPGPADGVSGRRTQEAIRAYQYRFRLPIDGVASRPLLDHMRFTRTQAAPPQQQPALYQPPPPAQQPPAQQPPPYGSQPPPPGYATPQPAAAAQTVPLAAIDQSHCRPYTQTIAIEGQQETVNSGRACLQPDGNWRIVE